jgi:phenylacetate-CoA ligase
MASSGPDDGLIEAFRAAARLPWYRRLLTEQHVDPDEIGDAAAFSRRCPILTKANTFDRFPLDQLARTPIASLAGVLTSSGHGGRFSFGLQTRAHARDGGRDIDAALDAAFGVASRTTLAVNCLPMGVGFSSECMTVATTSVREDMAVALIKAFGPSYDQVVVVADPLFANRLLDHAQRQSLDWRQQHVNMVLGEETFGEQFRTYVSHRLGLDPAHPDEGYVMSSFGVGELGLHLLFETAATIAVRRAVAANPALARDLGVRDHARSPIPMFFSCHPGRTFIEIVDPDADGYGRLTISMLDPSLPIPLLRYQPGDLARLVPVERVASVLRAHDARVPEGLPPVLVALEGRERERLPDGSHVAVYKDALYADHALARQLTGAFRLKLSDGVCTMHVQRLSSDDGDHGLADQLRAAMPAAMRPANLIAWPYPSFPFGMGLDYERKFTYFAER